MFSNVFDKLKPNSRVFSTNSLSRYNTTLCLFDIAFAPGGLRGEVLCYKFGACSGAGALISKVMVG